MTKLISWRQVDILADIFHTNLADILRTPPIIAQIRASSDRIYRRLTIIGNSAYNEYVRFAIRFGTLVLPQIGSWLLGNTPLDPFQRENQWTCIPFPNFSVFTIEINHLVRTTESHYGAYRSFLDDAINTSDVTMLLEYDDNPRIVKKFIEEFGES